MNLSKPVYNKYPWVIHRKNTSWAYVLRAAKFMPYKISQLSIISDDHFKAVIYNRNRKSFLKGNLQSLTLYPTDQILLARALAEKSACIIHAAGLAMEDRGFLFVGHSDAGKSTIVSMLQKYSKVLCDDRIIVRKSKQGFDIYGTWSHGDIPDVSADSAPLKAILFLEKSSETELIHLESKQEIIANLLVYLIKPLVTLDWIKKMVSLIEQISFTTPCYILKFKKDESPQNLIDQLKHATQ
jgi:hypothetical protein